MGIITGMREHGKGREKYIVLEFGDTEVIWKQPFKQGIGLGDIVFALLEEQESTDDKRHDCIIHEIHRLSPLTISDCLEKGGKK